MYILRQNSIKIFTPFIGTEFSSKGLQLLIEWHRLRESWHRCNSENVYNSYGQNVLLKVKRRAVCDIFMPIVICDRIFEDIIKFLCFLKKNYLNLVTMALYQIIEHSFISHLKQPLYLGEYFSEFYIKRFVLLNSLTYSRKIWSSFNKGGKIGMKP